MLRACLDGQGSPSSSTKGKGYLSYLLEANRHQFSAFEICYHPPWLQPALAAAAPMHDQLRGNPLCNVHSERQALRTHGRRVMVNGNTTLAAQHFRHRRRSGAAAAARI